MRKTAATIAQVLTTSSLPRLETEVLLAFILKKSREYLLTRPEKNISRQKLADFKKLEQKRKNNWPLPYLTGQQDFYGLTFQVSPAVLIPRPETELVVDMLKTALSEVAESSRPLVIDVGTGSGVIITSLAHEIKKLPRLFNRTAFLGIDISPRALKIATGNAKQQKLDRKIKFLKSDLLNNFPAPETKDRPVFIAANLPYLTPKQIKAEISIKREPKLALNGGRDGLKYYRQLFKQLNSLPIQSLFVICEIDPGQKITITKLAKSLIKNSKTEIKRDWRQKNRFLIIKKTA